MSSFDDAIMEEPDRFIGYAYKNNPNLKNFGDFKNAFLYEFGQPEERNAIDEYTLIKLFESNENKRRIKRNIDEKEFEALFGDGHVVQRMPTSEKKMVVLTEKKVHKKSYETKKGTTVKAYNSTKPRKFKPLQIKLIKSLKQRVHTKQITIDEATKVYNSSFPNEPRTKSSIQSKMYRIK